MGYSQQTAYHIKRPHPIHWTQMAMKSNVWHFSQDELLLVILCFDMLYDSHLYNGWYPSWCFCQNGWSLNLCCGYFPYNAYQKSNCLWSICNILAVWEIENSPFSFLVLLHSCFSKKVFFHYENYFSLQDDCILLFCYDIVKWHLMANK